MIQQTEVAIIGAGCAGWFVSLELARRGVSCIILDRNPPAAFASTRNQGWLQSGVWHATVANDPITARACRDGSDWIRSHYPDAIRPGIPCYFLMQSEEDLDLCLTRCQQEDIAAHPVSIDDVREPILGQSSLTHAVKASDVPVDTSRLLQMVADQASQLGVRFQSVSSLNAIRPLWAGKRWRLFLDRDHEIQCESVVLTCGTYIPEMFKCFLPDQTPPFKRTKVPVMVLHGEISRSMLITLYAPDGTTLVPYNGVDGNGVTVCLSGTDVDCIDARDITIAPPLLERYLARYAESFSDFYKGLAAMVKQRSIPAHIYACQKLHFNDDFAANPSGRRSICLSYEPPTGRKKNLFVFYPGKFTASPIAARTCVEQVERYLGHTEVLFKQVEKTAFSPKIARQRYYDVPEYELIAENDRLCFKSAG